MNKYILFLAAGLTIVIGVFQYAGFKLKNEPIHAQQGPLIVSASFYPVYFFSAEIGGKVAEVFDLTPAGVEPHDYEPRPSDIVRMDESRLLVLNGLGLEPWGAKVGDLVNEKQTIVIEAGENISTSTEKTGETDPHVWLSPELAKNMVDRILQGFVLADPENQAYFVENATALKNKLDELDLQYKTGLSDCRQTTFITAHAAFGYLADEFGLKQEAVAGLSPDAEPSAKELSNLADFAKKHNIQYIFFETNVSPKLAETLASEVGAKTLVLSPLEALTPEEQARGEDYFSIMSQNLSALEEALQCSH